jgi:hypothetical protein
MAVIKVTKEHGLYDCGIGGVNMPIIYAGDEATGQAPRMLIGYNGLLASKTNVPAGLIVGAGQYRNRAMKGEKLAVTTFGYFSVDTAGTIGAPLYVGDDGHLVDVQPASGYQEAVAYYIRDTQNTDMTATTSKDIIFRVK